MTTRAAFITGGNRGLGLEVARGLAAQGYAVWLGSRDLAHAEQAIASLGAAAARAHAVQVDLADRASLDAALARLEREPIDVLINNAGVYDEGQRLLTGDEGVLRRAFEVHVFAPILLARALVPGMQRRRYGRIVNLSSGLGSMSGGLGGPAPYAVTKACLNAVTLALAGEVGPHVKVNSVDPGWVRTGMGGAGAPRSVEQGADTVLWLATLGDDGPTGGFFRDRRSIPW